ncbi:MAG TPA: cytochrome P450 [Solirubrobacteraceae bacterium]|nr:cytochrome P450 [Solirubrobacteraceae bacterium]
MQLPPGPSEPAALQMTEWIVRPTALLRRCHARYGEPFTLKISWSDAPMVLVSEPQDIKRIFSAGPDVLRGGASSTVLEPFAGPRSILLLDDAEHLRQRRLMLPPFHGEALARWRDTIARLTHEELDRWAPGVPLAAHRRMQVLTLELILRVVFGTGDPQLRDAIRRTLDMTTSLPRLVAMSLVRGPVGPWASFRRAVRRLDRLIYERIDADVDDGSVLALLRSARHEDGSPPAREELRDQLVTLLAAGHETTAGALGWAVERLARHPDVLARVRAGDDAYLDAVVKEVLRTRPVLSIVGRKTIAEFEVGGWTLPPGVHVTPCIYLTHRRADLWDEPTAFRPDRFLAGAPDPYTFIPFGGGTRRCLGAAFATLELREVLRAVAARLDLRPDRPEGERMRRRSITLTPARGGYVIPESLASSAARHADVLPPQPPHRELPDLQPRPAG